MFPYVDAIRKFEGFAPQAQWDYAQVSNGYGTRARFPGEVIDRAEAERRFTAAVARARAVVERAAPHLDEGTKAALTSLTYNAGDAWVESGLGEAVCRGDLEEVRSLFAQYNKAGGEVLPGLVSRRAAEALWIGGGVTESEPAPREVASAAAATEPALPLARLPQPQSETHLRPSAVFEGAPANAPFALQSVAGRLAFATHERLGSAPVALANLSDIARLVSLDGSRRLRAKDDERQGLRYEPRLPGLA